MSPCKLDTVSTLADKKIICSYVDAPASGSAPSSEGTIEAFCRAGDRMTLALGKIDSSAGAVLYKIMFLFNTVQPRIVCTRIVCFIT